LYDVHTLVRSAAAKLKASMDPHRKWRVESVAAGGRAKLGTGERWYEELHRWQLVVKPRLLARHAALSTPFDPGEGSAQQPTSGGSSAGVQTGVQLAPLSAVQLVAHIHVLGAHLTEGAMNHHIFDGVAFVPVGRYRFEGVNTH
jgi:hypothetical protein